MTDAEKLLLRNLKVKYADWRDVLMAAGDEEMLDLAGRIFALVQDEDHVNERFLLRNGVISEWVAGAFASAIGLEELSGERLALLRGDLEASLKLLPPQTLEKLSEPVPVERFHTGAILEEDVEEEQTGTMADGDDTSRERSAKDEGGTETR